MRLGALEAGGTKMVLGVLDKDLQILHQTSLPTTTPEETLPRIVDFFTEHSIDALGIGSFGPVNLQQNSKAYGTILNTPKLAWRGYPLLGTLADALGVPCKLDTDVNAAALAEVRLGAAKGKDSCIYFTIGTGIGGGVYVEGQLLHGLMHPEWGHVLISRHPEDPLLTSVCPNHQHCAEGFASGPAMQARWGIPGKDLPPDHRGWDLEAYYLGQLCANAILSLSPQVILMGGGVMHQEQLLPKVRENTLTLLGGYLDLSQMPPMEQYIIAPKLWPNSGLLGAALLAKDALEQSTN